MCRTAHMLLLLRVKLLLLGVVWCWLLRSVGVCEVGRNGTVWMWHWRLLGVVGLGWRHHL